VGNQNEGILSLLSMYFVYNLGQSLGSHFADIPRRVVKTLPV